MAMTAYLRNKYGNSRLAESLGESGIDRFVQENLEYSDIDCPLDTLSNLIEREGVEHIDVLKIDTEKSEADVLNGIRQEHWPMIDQIVMEVHDVDDRLGQIVRQLSGRGYTCRVEGDELLRGTFLYNLYARREDARPVPGFAPGTLILERDELIHKLRMSLSKSLPPHMMPSQIHVLTELPLTTNGKVDERKLAPSEQPALPTESLGDDADPVERQVKEIWMQVLKLKQIARTVTLDSIGAHSLAAAMISLRLFKAFGVEVRFKELRGDASIASIAGLIRTAKSPRDAVSAPESSGQVDFQKESLS